MLNEAHLPCPLPFLDRLVSLNGRLHRFMHLIPDQPIHTMLTGKPFGDMILVFPDRLIKSDVTPTYNVPFRLLASR